MTLDKKSAALADKAAAAIAAADWPKARAALQAFAKLKGAPPSVFYNLAKVLVAEGRRDQAKFWFERAVAADPAYAIAWFELGRWRLEAGDFPGAEAAFSRAAELDPSDLDAVRNAARLSERLGAFSDARQRWNALAAGEPSDAEARLGLARAALELGDICAAEAALAELPAAARPAILSLRTKTARGRLSLDPKRLV